MFVVQRSNGGFYSAGAWSDQFSSLPYYGVVSIATPEELDALPDSDHVHAAIVINCELPLYVTRLSPMNGGPATSDLIVWNNENYRIIQTHNYSSRGYWWAIAARMAGS